MNFDMSLSLTFGLRALFVVLLVFLFYCFAMSVLWFDFFRSLNTFDRASKLSKCADVHLICLSISMGKLSLCLARLTAHKSRRTQIST